MNLPEETAGILLVDKARGYTSFSLVSLLRKMTNIAKIGHSGTLDPFATGLMVMLIGRQATTQADRWIACDKQYRATFFLGATTDSYDLDGKILSTSPIIPTPEAIAEAIAHFQGGYRQMPPMFSAKKIAGRKLYQMARQGITVERALVPVKLIWTLLSYNYPYLEVEVDCSKGTYIRSLAYDLGQLLGCGAYVHALQRLRSGPFELKESIPQAQLAPGVDITPYLKRL